MWIGVGQSSRIPRPSAITRGPRIRRCADVAFSIRASMRRVPLALICRPIHHARCARLWAIGDSSNADTVFCLLGSVEWTSRAGLDHSAVVVIGFVFNTSSNTVRLHRGAYVGSTCPSVQPLIDRSVHLVVPTGWNF